jgi:hypothetical protein
MDKSGTVRTSVRLLLVNIFTKSCDFLLRTRNSSNNQKNSDEKTEDATKRKHLEEGAVVDNETVAMEVDTVKTKKKKKKSKEENDSE